MPLCFLWEVTRVDKATSTALPCHLDAVPGCVFVSMCVPCGLSKHHKFVCLSVSMCVSVVCV